MSDGLLDRYVNNNKKSFSQQPKRFNSKCRDCKSLFFGATQKEANARKDRHDCPRRK